MRDIRLERCGHFLLADYRGNVDYEAKSETRKQKHSGDQ